MKNDIWSTNLKGNYVGSVLAKLMSNLSIDFISFKKCQLEFKNRFVCFYESLQPNITKLYPKIYHGIRGRSQTTFTIFVFFWPHTPLRLHILWYKSLQKVDFFDHLPPFSCKRSLWTAPKHGRLYRDVHRLGYNILQNTIIIGGRSQTMFTRGGG